MNIQTTVTLEAMVAKVIKNRQGIITFFDAGLPVEGRNHNRALFIPAEVRGKRTSYMMVDDGTAISVYPLQILAN